MTAEFVVKLDEGMLEYFREMVREMTQRLGVSRAEAVARINERYGELEVSAYPDLMCHELPEFWAYGAYYQPDEDGRLPTGDADEDEGIDLTNLAIRPLPPKDSPAWTIEDQ